MKSAKWMAVAAVVALPMLASAQTSVSDIVTAANSTWSAVAAACVAIGTFVVGYRLVRRIK